MFSSTIIKWQITLLVDVTKKQKKNNNKTAIYCVYRLLKSLHQHTLFLKQAMTNWKGKLTLKTQIKSLEAVNVDIWRGIIEGDALSPLWFCLALRPLIRLFR